jgi:hypothetical protein
MLQKEMVSLDAKKVHENVYEKPNENKDNEPNKRSIISFTR